MASSTYYYNLYKQKKSDATTYTNRVSDLNKILTNLSYNLSDEISAVNTKITDLKDDLFKGVRHNSIYTNKASMLNNEKQKSVGADATLSSSESSLQDEINRLNGLKNQAITDRDYYYNKYVEAKAAEKAAKS
jgi:exonuclease VII large subunit